MIELDYGVRQRFRFRHGDINVLGCTSAALPVRRSVFTVNRGPPVHFYVEPSAPEQGATYPYGAGTPSVMRLSGRPGRFNIEIPTGCAELRAGSNALRIHVAGHDGGVDQLDVGFHWDPRPIELPLDLSDVSGCDAIQEIGQVVDGAFDVDVEQNLIRSRAPVAADTLLLLGSPWGSQEATYDVRFAGAGGRGTFLGTSDFFAGHEEQSPGLGIKPGYSTAGLVTIRPSGLTETWIAVGDLLTDKEGWVIKNLTPPQLALRADAIYSARHQVVMGEGINCVRFRIWKKGTPEPRRWLVQDNNAHLAPHLPRISKASFGLFQYGGAPTEWSNIRVRRLDVRVDALDLRRRRNYPRVVLRRIRNVADALRR